MASILQHAAARLPAEVCDMFIDNVNHDKQTLASCTLVCHAWMPRGRLHLFYSICAVAQSGNFKDFLAFLADAPYVCHYIRRLELSGRPKQNTMTSSAWWSCEQNASAPAAGALRSARAGSIPLGRDDVRHVPHLQGGPYDAGALLHQGPSLLEVSLGPSGPLMDLAWDPHTNDVEPVTAETWKVLHLASCTSLQSLIFLFDLDDDPENVPLIEQEWQSFKMILSTVSPTLQRVTFRCDIWEGALDYIDDTEIVDWDGLDQALSAFENLVAVKFDICVVTRDISDEKRGSVFQEFCEVARHVMPRLYEREVLQIACRNNRHF